MLQSVHSSIHVSTPRGKCVYDTHAPIVHSPSAQMDEQSVGNVVDTPYVRGCRVRVSVCG
jgi:hypothetical protein